jgi:hypothetical protein
VRRQLAVAVVGLLTLAPALSGCDLGSLLSNKPGSCDVYQAKPDSGTKPPLLLVLLDLSDNSADTGQQVATALQPYLDGALANGSYVKLIASGGAAAGTRTFSCFTGTTPYLVKRANSNRQVKDRAAGSTALQTEVAQDVQETPVSATGSVTALLGAANDDVGTIEAVPGVQIGDVTVLVWSNLLGTGENGDCMKVDGQQASVQVAEGVVKRCFATTQIAPVKDAKIRFLGANQGNLTPPQQDLSRYLREELCRRLSSDCS